MTAKTVSDTPDEKIKLVSVIDVQVNVIHASYFLTSLFQVKSVFIIPKQTSGFKFVNFYRSLAFS